MADSGVASGEAVDATVSTAAPNKEARGRLLELAADMPDGDAKRQILAMADTLTTPAEAASRLADEADEAVAAIREKISGMGATLKAKESEAKEYRAEAKKLERE